MINRPSIDELFGPRSLLPDADVNERLNRLVGLDQQKSRLSKMLAALINPAKLQQWAQQNHGGASLSISAIARRPPLVVLAGDVGSGKTELAETIGDKVAREHGIDITLYPLSLSTRGQGRVGEMTQLLTAAFDHVATEARKLKSQSGKARGGIILLVDEADALAQSREAAQMHHEDRAGVNAFIRGIDHLSKAELPAAVVMCTNRLAALDPAVSRRAADIMKFSRPTDEQRQAVLTPPFQELGFSSSDIAKLVHATGPHERGYGYTYSDLVQRLIPAIVLDAFPDKKVLPGRAVEIALATQPTPPFVEGTK